jgi:hypothetical protein
MYALGVGGINCVSVSIRAKKFLRGYHFFYLDEFKFVRDYMVLREEKSAVETMVEDYILFVESNIENFKKIGDLIRKDQVAMDKVFKAMANYYNVCLALGQEYQRLKIERVDLEIEYEAKYADWFQEAKAVLYLANEEKKAKPALKEIEQQIIAAHKLDYFVWKRQLANAEAKCDFFIRLRETLNKYDGILTGLAASMRSELRALSIEDRAENTSQRLSGYVKESLDIDPCSEVEQAGRKFS